MNDNKSTGIISQEDIAVIDKFEKLKEKLYSIRHTKTPKEKIKYRDGAWNKETQSYDKWKYVERIYVCECLDKYYPGWKFEIIPHSFLEVMGYFQVEGKLTILEPELKIVREFTCFGQEEIKYYTKDVYKKVDGIETLIHKAGDPISQMYSKACETDALKRCASMAGLFNDVYSDDINTENISEEPTKEKLEENEFFVNVVLPRMIEQSEEAYKLLKQINSYFTGKADIEVFMKFYGVIGYESK